MTAFSFGPLAGSTWQIRGSPWHTSHMVASGQVLRSYWALTDRCLAGRVKACIEVLSSVEIPLRPPLVAGAVQCLVILQRYFDSPTQSINQFNSLSWDLYIDPSDYVYALS